MVDTEGMTPQPFDVITFDCYGTLIDWERGISEAFLDDAARAGVTLTRDQVLDAYAELEPLVEQERYRLYREVLADVARRVAARFGWQTDGAFLPDSLPSWTPFPDTNAALEHLRQAGYSLGILSNTDDDLIAATRRHLEVEFELIITAQQVRSYKPAPGHFTAARDRLAGRRWLHAAQSNFHDIVPTNELGVPNAWINRKHEEPRPEGTPMYEYPSMATFASAFSKDA
ncbi:MAG: HAD-superfamily hydrolase, subfamily variant 1 [Acidobacteria bacterium]|nr:HAD-superfamily hydrolase, subfamily variant 1 [Acidobacteriota bacterium]